MLPRRSAPQRRGAYDSIQMRHALSTRQMGEQLFFLARQRSYAILEHQVAFCPVARIWRSGCVAMRRVRPGIGSLAIAKPVCSPVVVPAQPSVNQARPKIAANLPATTGAPNQIEFGRCPIDNGSRACVPLKSLGPDPCGVAPKRSPDPQSSAACKRRIIVTLQAMGDGSGCRAAVPETGARP